VKSVISFLLAEGRGVDVYWEVPPEQSHFITFDDHSSLGELNTALHAILLFLFGISPPDETGLVEP